MPNCQYVSQQIVCGYNKMVNLNNAILSQNLWSQWLTMPCVQSLAGLLLSFVSAQRRCNTYC
jgi:hypothetical protein